MWFLDDRNDGMMMTLICFLLLQLVEWDSELEEAVSSRQRRVSKEVSSASCHSATKSFQHFPLRASYCILDYLYEHYLDLEMFILLCFDTFKPQQLHHL